MYNACSLYAVQSKKMLCEILDISDKHWLKKSYVLQNIHPFIDSTNKPRLIEAPSFELKSIQKKIKNSLMNCDFPDYVFSGVKNKSYVENAKIHAGLKYVYKIDISAFFPNISREKVYKFYKDELKTSSDVAECLTNFCTSDLSQLKEHKEEIALFLLSKKIKHNNHLCTGSSSSPLLSYLVNKAMFSEMKNISDFENIEMTVYLDDVVFSSFSSIKKYFRDRILKIVSKYGYNISKDKINYYDINDVKKVTGVIIKPDGSLDVPNKLRYKVIRRFNNGDLTVDLNKLRGCVIAARQIDKNLFPNILKFINNSHSKSKERDYTT